MAKFCIDELKFQRSVLKVKGTINEIENSQIDKIVFKNKKDKEDIEVKNIEIKDNSFEFRFPVLAAKEEYPITSGSWYLELVLKDGKRKKAKVSDLVYDKIHLNKYDGDDIDAIFDRTPRNYFHGYSRIDTNKNTFYLFVDFKVPVKKSLIKKQMKIFKDMIKKTNRTFLNYCFRMIFSFFNKFIKKNGKRVFFTSASRAKLSGNEKFIYDRMIERDMGKDYSFKFNFRESINAKRSFVDKIKFTYYLATSDYIFLDDYQPEIYKNDYDENVKVIQVWHACGAFKTLGFERLGSKGAPPFKTRVHKCYTHVPVSSEHSVRHHAEAFAIDESKFYPVGIARTDIFFDEEYKRNVKEEIYKELPQLKDADQVIMYAPTFRGNNARDAYFPMHMINFEKLGEYLKKVNGIMLIKMHPFVKLELDIPDEYKKFFIDASSQREINHLLMVTDVLITDYSSVIYEMALLKKPMVFYAFDLETYEGDRGFYEPYKDIIPGEIVKSIDQLVDVLDKNQYDEEKMNWFLNKNFAYTDGKSTDRVIDLVFNDIKPE